VIGVGIFGHTWARAVQLLQVAAFSAAAPMQPYQRGLADRLIDDDGFPRARQKWESPWFTRSVRGTRKSAQRGRRRRRRMRRARK
jgi:hypothetical protein